MTHNPTAPWSRQGARNVAGVTYQVAVSAHILVRGRAGGLPITSVTPEGMEDIDCTCRDGSVLVVQAKERGDGSSTLACHAIAEILKHALPALEATTNSRFVIATNAQLGNNLVFTGWHQSIQQAFSPAGIASLTDALDATARPKHGVLLPRSGIVALERHLRASTTQILSETYGIAPAAAASCIPYWRRTSAKLPRLNAPRLLKPRSLGNYPILMPLFSTFCQPSMSRSSTRGFEPASWNHSISPSRAP